MCGIGTSSCRGQLFRLIFPSIEREIRAELTEQAAEQSH